MRSLLARTFVVMMVAGAAVGCGDKLPKATLISHMRVLGARTEVKGDETRSTPKPGETATLTWAMAYPKVDEDDSTLSSLFITCTAPTQFTGIPICQEFIDAAMSPDDAVAKMLGKSTQKLSCAGQENMAFTVGTLGGTCVSGTPKLDVKIEAGSKIPKKLVRGILCRNGTPLLNPDNPELFECSRNKGVKASDFEEIAVYGTVPIQLRADLANENPSLTDATLKQSGKTWMPIMGMLPAMDDDCADAAKMGMLPSSDGRSVTIGFSYPAKLREKYGGELETLEISAYATAGEVERRFIVFDPDAEVKGGQLSHEITWKMSAADRMDVKSGGELVRFFFTILDRRGGFDVTDRALCVTK
jgi:hypothetical protein